MFCWAMQQFHFMMIALQINPSSTDEVEMDSMWSRIGVHHSDSVLDDKSVSHDMLYRVIVLVM